MCLVCLLLCKEVSSSPLSLKLLRGGIWACMRYHCLCLFLWLWDGDNVSQLPYVWYYVVVMSSFKHETPVEPMCFNCLMFSLSGPCELLFLLGFITSCTRVVVSVMLYPCISVLICLSCVFRV